jgi:pimeloyl-ACP methyl ester carboxylesterase
VTATTYNDARVQGIRMRYATSGEGPTVVMLHGFPETHRSWDLQVPDLVRAGFRVVRPDLRGYGDTDHPPGGYDIATLGNDVAALIESLDAGPVVLVGHDWGGAIAWFVASRHPELLTRLVILNCPHPVLMARALVSDPMQRRRSWYMFFFQLPRLPELWLTGRDGRNIRSLFRASTTGSRRPPPELVEASRRALLAPGAATCAIAYYRTAMHEVFPPWRFRRYRSQFGRIEVPVTVLWGENDSALGIGLLAGTREYAPRLDVRRITDAGHFVHQEQPEEVNRLLLECLSAAC